MSKKKNINKSSDDFLKTSEKRNKIINEFYKDVVDTFKVMMNLQKDLQVILNEENEKDIKDRSWQEISDRILKNKHWFDKEFSELMDYLYYKDWKDYSNIDEKKYLNENGKEILFEVSDMIFFFLNIVNLIKEKFQLQNEDIFRLYVDKWISNFERVKSGNFFSKNEERPKLSFGTEKLMKLLGE